MVLTERDRRMLQWINGYGFVNACQAAVWMGVGYRVGSRRLYRLTEAGYLQHKRFQHATPRVYWLTRAGWEASGDHLSAPKAINRVTYFHDAQLVDLSQALIAETGGAFMPERRLRAERLAKGRRTRSHLPDGLLYLDDHKSIAIELECSMKAAGRVRKIVTDYDSVTCLNQGWETLAAVQCFFD